MFESADQLIQKHPHAAFERLNERGYKLLFEFDSDDGGKTFTNLKVKAVDGDKLIGAADFTDDGDTIHCQNVLVEPRYRRQGIANAMYVLAEKAFGKLLTDFWAGWKSEQQTAAAKAMWAQPNRPFGRSAD
jgi:GNAT superfamily N-acetyltransferase